MTNSITFSSDLDKLFLVEESQVVSFPLSGKKGVVIGKIHGQLIAASANSKMLSLARKPTVIELETAQIQFYYSTQFEQAFIIIIEIDFNKTKGIQGNNYKTRSLFYNLNKENLLVKKEKGKMMLYKVPLISEPTDNNAKM